MKNILLAIESLIILVFCISWCFCLQKNQDLAREEMNNLRRQTYELAKEIRLLKTDIDLIQKGE